MARNLDFQLPNGPFELKHEYTYNEFNHEFDNYAVFENEKYVKTFTASAHSDWGSSLDAREFIANQLIERYPDFLDKNAYYADSTPYPKQVPLGFIKESIEANINKIENNIDRSCDFLQNAGYEDLSKHPIDDRGYPQKLVTDKYTMVEQWKLHEAQSLFYKMKEDFENGTKALKLQNPGLFEFRKQLNFQVEKYRLYKQSKKISLVEADIKKLESAISLKFEVNKKEIMDIAQELSNHNRWIFQAKDTLEELTKLNSTIERLNKPEHTIEFMGNAKDPHVILEQSPEIFSQVHKFPIVGNEVYTSYPTVKENSMPYSPDSWTSMREVIVKVTDTEIHLAFPNRDKSENEGLKDISVVSIDKWNKNIFYTKKEAEQAHFDRAAKYAKSNDQMYIVEVNKIMEKQGKWPGAEADQKIARKLLLEGKEKMRISFSMMKNSPELASRTPAQAFKYAEQTLKQVLTPEFTKQLSSLGKNKGMER